MTEHSLLHFVQNMNMKANYQPIVIKMLLENKSHSTSIKHIRKKFDELNFGRHNFVSSDGGDPMGNSAIISVKQALINYVIFPKGSSEGNVTLIEQTYDESTKDECLKICGQKIVDWHFNELETEENDFYFIRAGPSGEYWEEFRTNNFVAVDYVHESLDPEATGNFDLSGLTKDEIKKRKGSNNDVTELYNISQIKKGDIIAVVIDKNAVKEFAIATSNYYFEESAKKNKHRANVEYLNFGTSKIAHDNIKGILESKIVKNFFLDSDDKSVNENYFLNPEKFEELHEKFLKNIYESSITSKKKYTKEESIFTNFENKFLVESEINPKNNIFVNAHNILEIGKWDEFIKTPGLIRDKLEQVCVLKISQQLLTQGRWGEKTTPDNILRLLNQTQILDFEKIIYKLFLESPDEEIFSKNFDELYDFLYDNDLNKKSQFLAYLAFLVDKEKFIPIRKQQFDKVLEYYNINEKFSGFSWDKYNTYLKLIKALKVKLSEKYPIPNTIEAHSYLWIVSDILKNQAKIGDTVSNDVYARGLELKPNLILYGPPGTGKTYHAKVIAEKITYGQLTKIGICWPTDKDEEKIEDFQNIIKDNGKALWGVNWAIDQVNQYDFPIKGYVYYKQNIIAIASISNCTLHEETIDTDLKLRPEKWHKGLDYKNYLHLTSINRCELFSHKKLKLYDSIKVIPDIIQQRVYVKQLPEFISKVTFHPSYSYEDFVEGFRPNVSGVGEQPYILDDGIFKRICNQAKNDLKNKYVIIIDEINRGNIPKIFGELITLIEEDKRKSDNSLQLTYSKDDFFVPNNVIIIGTMNTADKSLMQMDDALKRRFAFEELMPDYSQLSAELLKREIPYAEEYVKILTRINEKITGDGKDNDLMKQFRDRQIGHSYFWNIGKDDRDPDDDLQKVFKYDIIPLLQDYFYGDYSKIREILGKKGEFAIIDENNRTTNLINDIEQCTELRAKLLDILE